MKTSVVFTYNNQVGVAKNTLHPQANVNANLIIKAIEKANEKFIDEVKTILINVRQSGVAPDGFSHYADIKVSFLFKSEFTDKLEGIRMYDARLDSDTGVVFPKFYHPNTHITKRGVYINEVSGRKLVSEEAIFKNVVKSWAGYIVTSLLYKVQQDAARLEREQQRAEAKQKWADKVGSLVDLSLAQMKAEIAASLDVNEILIETALASVDKVRMEAEVLVEHTKNNVKVRLYKSIRGNWETGAVIADEAKLELTASQAVTKNALAKFAGLSIL
jgi:hypothetical protein